MHPVVSPRPGRLMRLWLAAAVLAGVALMHGLQCHDSLSPMVAGMPPTGIHLDVRPSIVDTGARIVDGGDGPAGTGGVLLGACLALLAGVLGTVLLGALGRRRLAVVALAAARPGVRLRARWPAPTLAQLCLLRT